jgi:cyclic pyranopterin phosphate synthase
VELGVTKIRITGGEPLIRQNVIALFNEVGRLTQLQELTLTSNGSRLEALAEPLVAAGVSRINVSLDSLNSDKFTQLTRFGKLDTVLRGLAAAKTAGFRRIKINSVILNNHNDDEILPLIEFALKNGFDISYIEEMPLGKIDGHNRQTTYLSSNEIQERISKYYAIQAVTETTGGPSRYWRIPGCESRIGFISPHSNNFCASCNRVRVSAEGRLLLCLGNEHSVDLRQVIRCNSAGNKLDLLKDTIVQALKLKPERHEFNIDQPAQILRFMNATGG